MGLNKILPATILIVYFFGAAYGQQNKCFIDESFESPSFIKNWHHREACCSYSITRSDSVAREGNYSIRVELNKTDSNVAGNKRAELIMANEPTIKVDRWYRFSIFLPVDFAIDSASEIVAQWHEIPDFKWGESWRVPPISLQIVKDKWETIIFWAKDPVNRDQTISGKMNEFLGSIEKGKWTDWVFHIYFSYKDDGILQVWKNGEQLLNYKGPNYYNDQKGPFFKLGIYKWDWKYPATKSIVSKRVLFFDSIKINDKQTPIL